MEDEGIIQGSTLTLDYEKMGYSFIAHVGVCWPLLTAC